MTVGRGQATGAVEVAAALDSESPLRLLLHAREPSDAAAALVARAAEAGVPTRAVSAPALKRWSRRVDESAPCELLGLLGPAPAASLPELMRSPGAVWLLDGLAYPGNIGFAIRTAEVSGAAGVVVAGEHPPGLRRRAFRASMQSQLFLPVLFDTTAAVIDAVNATVAANANVTETRRRIVVIEDCGDRAPWDVDLTGDVLLVVGGERDGVSQPVLDAADAVTRVPMAGFIPSYNVQAAVAAAAIERLRQEEGAGGLSPEA